MKIVHTGPSTHYKRRVLQQYYSIVIHSGPCTCSKTRLLRQLSLFIFVQPVLKSRNYIEGATEGIDAHMIQPPTAPIRIATEELRVTDTPEPTPPIRVETEEEINEPIPQMPDKTPLLVRACLENSGPNPRCLWLYDGRGGFF